MTVLWLIALLSALAMAASITFRGFAAVVAVDRYRVRTEALLTAGLRLLRIRSKSWATLLSINSISALSCLPARCAPT